jgi:protein arginine kinase activator
MQCSECNKRPATLHLTQIINGQKKEIHVCDSCAQKKGYIHTNDDPYSLHDLLSGLFNFDPTQMDIQPPNDFFDQVAEVECNKCHITFQDFRRIGKFGCAECYHTFSTKLDAIFRKVHSGNTKHLGKIPKRKGVNLHKKKVILQYREQIQKLINAEEFEEAALVRDKIRKLESPEMGGNHEY